MEKKEREQIKRERFLRVAQRRTQRILRAVRLLANCGNRGSYAYTDADVAKIFDAVGKEVDRARARFADRREDFHLE